MLKILSTKKLHVMRIKPAKQWHKNSTPIQSYAFYLSVIRSPVFSVRECVLRFCIKIKSTVHCEKNSIKIN